MLKPKSQKAKQLCLIYCRSQGVGDFLCLFFGVLGGGNGYYVWLTGWRAYPRAGTWQTPGRSPPASSGSPSSPPRSAGRDWPPSGRRSGTTSPPSGVCRTLGCPGTPLWNIKYIKIQSKLCFIRKLNWKDFLTAYNSSDESTCSVQYMWFYINYYDNVLETHSKLVLNFSHYECSCVDTGINILSKIAVTKGLLLNKIHVLTSIIMTICLKTHSTLLL